MLLQVPVALQALKIKRPLKQIRHHGIKPGIHALNYIRLTAPVSIESTPLSQQGEIRLNKVKGNSKLFEF